MARPYPRHISGVWWLARWPYRIFLARELSAVFMAAYMVILLVLVTKVHDGQAAFDDYLDVLQSPFMIAFHVVALLFSLLHTVTFFQAMPKGMPMQIGEEKLSDPLMIGPLYVALAAVSAVVAVIFLA